VTSLPEKMGTCTGTNGCMTLTCGNTAMFFHSDPRALGSVEDHLTINIDGRTRNFGHCSLLPLIQTIYLGKNGHLPSRWLAALQSCSVGPKSSAAQAHSARCRSPCVGPVMAFLLGYPLLTWNTPF